MQNSDSVFSKACSEISQSLLSTDKPTRNRVKTEIKRICAKYSLGRIPRNQEILSMVDGSDFDKLSKVLLKKPVKTASGVAVIALSCRNCLCKISRHLPP